VNKVSPIVIAAMLLSAGCGERINPSIVNERAEAVGLLSEEIKSRFPAGDVVLVLNPLGRDQPQVRALQDETIDMFQSALPGRSLRKTEPKLIKGLSASDWSARIRPGSTAPLSYIMEPNAFEVIARAHPDATVLVSLVGMPDSVAWMNEIPAVLLFPDLRVFGNSEKAIEAFQRGFVQAAAVVMDGSVVLITESNAGTLIPMLDW